MCAGKIKKKSAKKDNSSVKKNAPYFSIFFREKSNSDLAEPNKALAKRMLD